MQETPQDSHEVVHVNLWTGKTMTKFEPSTKHSQLTIIILFVLACIYSVLIPPFQSPDEFDHIKRAYALSKGNMAMITPENQSTGIMVDSGLNAYMAIFNKLPFKYENKLTSGDVHAAASIDWSGKEIFSPAPGVSYYFPIVYLPQAIGLGVGQMINLSVNTSYYLARFFSLLTITFLLIASFKIYRPNYLVLALLLIPMTLFQVSSASLDGVATALSVLVLSLFMRATTQTHEIDIRSFAILIVCTVILIMCRINLLPLCLILFYIAFKSKNKKYLYISIGAVALIFLWLAYAISTTVDKRVTIGASSIELMFFYISHPIATLKVLLNTITDVEKFRFYIHSFFGILGWLDHSLPRIYLTIAAVATTAIFILSCQLKTLRTHIFPRALLTFISFSSFILIFLLLLITWNPHPATIIEGVQGRYFLIPTLIIAYAISGNNLAESASKKNVVQSAFFLIVAISTLVTPKTILERYFVGNGSTSVFAALNISDNYGLCALDTPANHEKIESSETITMHGWAFDPSTSIIPPDISIHLFHKDSGLTLVIPAARGSERPDVAKAFDKPAAIKSGFISQTIPSKSLWKGVYEVSITQQNGHSIIPCQTKNMFEIIDDESS